MKPEAASPAGGVMTYVDERVAAITRRLRHLAISQELTAYDRSMFVGDANYLDDLAISYTTITQNTRAPAPPTEAMVERIRTLEAAMNDAIDEIEAGAQFTAQGLLRDALTAAQGEKEGG